MREFVSNAVQEGITDLSSYFMDFNNATDFLINLDYKELLRNGVVYLQKVRITEIKNNLFQYPDKTAQTQYTKYDVFGAGTNNHDSFVSQGLESFDSMLSGVSIRVNGS